ncbi:ABC transporter substrate-binding protein [Actinoplanes derwentensis]|nr:ABC transporter substrate-binding protein [Actinoplanes derwentensis]
MSRRRFLSLTTGAGAGFVLAGGALSACTPGSTSGGGDASKLVIGTSITTETLNPLDKQYATFQFNAFDALVRQLRGQTEAEPRLAESWTQVDDTTWDFKLRQGATFHDGTPVTAQDVAFTYSEVLDKQYANATTIISIGSVTAVDASTVRIVTKRPDPLLLNAVGQIFVVPAAYWKKVGADGFSAAPIGSGPYKITSFSPDTGIQFEAYQGFWGDKAATAAVELRFFSANTALAAAFEAGEIDAAHELPSTAIKTLAGGTNKVTAEVSGSQNMFQFNTTKGPFKDLRVRQAAVAAVDVKALLTALTDGAGDLEDGQLPLKGVNGYAESITRPAYDPERAKSLLTEAGATGAEITISGMALFKSLLEAIGGQLDAVGFKTTIKANETAVWVQEFKNGSDADIFYRGASYTGVFDANRPFQFVSFGAKPAVKDDKWTQLFQASRTEMDPEARRTKLAACSEYLQQQAYILWTYGRPSVNAVTPAVKDLDFTNGLVLLLDPITKTA